MDLSKLGPVATLRWVDSREHDGPREVTQEVGVDWTLLHSGGRRYWWTCPGGPWPGGGCGRRVGVLYHPLADRGLACRRCHGVRYASQRKTLKRSTLRGLG